MKEYSYSLYDKSGRIISPDLFSKASFISVWYGRKQILNKDDGISDYTKSRDKRSYLDSIIDYFDEIREERNRKARERRKKQSKTKTKSKTKTRTIKIEEPDEEEYATEDYSFEAPTLKKSEFSRFQYKKVVEPKNINQTPYGKFEITKTGLMFKELRVLDPSNEAQLNKVIQELKDLYRLNIFNLIEEAKAKGLEWGESNWFITRISIPKLDEKGNLYRDKILDTFDISERFMAERYAATIDGASVIERKGKLEVVKKKEVFNIKGEQSSIETMQKDGTMDSSGMGSSRTKIFDLQSAELALESLMEMFYRKAVEYVSRAYAVSGVIAGLEIEFISNTQL